MKTIRQSNLRGGIARLVEAKGEFQAILIIDGTIVEKYVDTNAEGAWAGLLASRGMTQEKPKKLEYDGEIYKEVEQIIEKSPYAIYLTGRAGTGKTTFLKNFLDKTQLRAIVIAPTGIAALNAGGQTAHSLFKFPPSLIGPQDIRRVREGRILRNIDLLVIDEISMVRADLMDAIDRSLRLHRGVALPFGGVKMLCVGDAAQLPPVVNRDDAPILEQWFGGYYFFDAPSVKALKWQVVELTHAFRQTEGHFLEILNRVRQGKITREDYDLLEDRIRKTAPDFEDNSVILTTTNEIARKINEKEMAALPDKPAIYCAQTEGNFDERLFPTEANLELKIGAKVMMLRNDSDRRWVNGSLATIVDTMDDTVKVKIGKYIHEVEAQDWERFQYELDENEKPKRKTVGVFRQLPIRPAWALTIHKAQGLSFDKVHIDFGWGTFAHGQTYVALSRCRSLNGLTISRNLKKSDIMVDNHAMAFLKNTDFEPKDNFQIGYANFIQEN